MARMNIVGSLCFCSECGSLLDLSSGTNTIKCDQCKAPYSTNEFSTLEITTKSSSKAFPSALRQKRSAIKTQNNLQGPARAKIKEECPNCKNEEMMFYQIQMRSADEGATVFYECERCGHKYSLQN